MQYCSRCGAFIGNARSCYDCGKRRLTQRLKRIAAVTVALSVLARCGGGLPAFTSPAMAQSVNVVPTSCPVVTVTTGGTAVKAIPSKVNGAVIVNPAAATENLFVDQTQNATTTASGTNYSLLPGQPWFVVPQAYNQAANVFNGVSVNAVSSAHGFFCIMW